jgi:hypothetical protein
MRRKWTAEHDATLIELWPIRTNQLKDMSRTLSFSGPTISRHAQLLGLPVRARRLHIGSKKPPVPLTPQQYAPTGWPDGWFIKKPTLDQLMSGGRPFKSKLSNL